MTNFVVIKEVCGKKILLAETTETVSTASSSLFAITWMTTAILAVMVVIIVPPEGIGIPMFSILCIYTLVAGISQLAFRIGDKTIRMFRVYCLQDCITLPKTNPTADQKAICKAAREIEHKILEAHQDRKELEEIAAGCK